MNKSFNLFALLLVMTLANAIEKKVAYSEIVSSLIQLNGDKSTNLANIYKILEDFETSNNFLKVMYNGNIVSCDNRKIKDDQKELEIKNDIEKYHVMINKLEEDIKEFNKEIKKDQTSIEDEITKIKKSKSSIVENKKELLLKEKEINDSINILKRLKNIAIDELQGSLQKQTEINKFDVTVITPTTFIQNSKEYMKTELKSLFKQNREYFDKGLMTFLILLTQSIEKQTYSNPQTVKKIIDMLEKLINNANKNIFLNSKNYENQQDDIIRIVDNSREIISKLYENIQFRINYISSNKKEISFYKNDIIFLQKVLNIRIKRNSSRQILCQKNKDFLNTHFKRYLQIIQQVNDLKNQLSE